jgi:hypothetical protein
LQSETPAESSEEIEYATTGIQKGMEANDCNEEHDLNTQENVSSTSIDHSNEEIPADSRGKMPTPVSDDQEEEVNDDDPRIIGSEEKANGSLSIPTDN